MNFTIKQARKHAGLTQADMATKMGMDRVTYIKLEKNEIQVTAARLYAVEKITGIPATVILDSIIKEHETAAPAVETQERRHKFVPESADGPCEPGESVECTTTYCGENEVITMPRDDRLLVSGFYHGMRGDARGGGV